MPKSSIKTTNTGASTSRENMNIVEFDVQENEVENNVNSESSDENTDDDIEPDNDEFEYDFIRTLGALHSKKPELIEKKYFKDNYICDVKDDTKKEKPMTLKDYERHIVMERDGKLEDEEQDMHNGEFSGIRGNNVAEDFPHDEEESSDEDDGSLFTSGLFKKVEPSSRELDRQKEMERKLKTTSEALEYIKGNKNDLSDENDQPLLDAVKEAWTNPDLPKKDKWLVDYFVNRRYMEEENETIEKAYNQIIIDEETISEDEETLNKMEEFETKYRFRFEEPDEEFIKTYPRIMTDTVRAKTNKRRDRRKRKKERDIKKKLEKQKEIDEEQKTMQKLVNEKLEKIKAVSGNTELSIEGEDVLCDFDPDAHDTIMSKLYGDDYYGGEDDGEYPEMTPEEQQLLEEDPLYDESAPKENKKKKNGAASSKLELYKLDFEDLVGGMTCKFKYKKVAPNDFGLTTGQILAADDKDLNRWCSIKKITKFNRTEEDEKRDTFHYRKRAENPTIQESYPSLFQIDDSEAVTAKEENKKKKKNLKKKLRRQQKAKLLAENNGLTCNSGHIEESNDEERICVDHSNQEEGSSVRNITNKITEDTSSNEEQLSFSVKKEVELETNNKVNKKNKKKRKRNDDNKPTEENARKKKNLTDSAQNSTPLSGISDMRLEAYGQNPKKAKNKLKYSKT